MSPFQEPFQIPAESIPHKFWSARPDGFIDYYNARLLEYAGKTIAEVRGWAWTSALHPDDSERSVAVWKETVATGSEYRIEHRIRRASDGQYRWHRTKALPQRDPAGHILRWFGTCTDIHESKHAEESMRENVAFRKRVFESSRIPIVVFDPATSSIIDCNPAATEIYGLASREETVGKSPLELSTAVQYDGTPSPEKARFYVAKALADGTAIFEWRQQRPNGETWDAEVHLMCFPCGQRQLLQFTLQDISERKRAEEALRSEKDFSRILVESSPAFFVAIGADGKTVLMNKAMLHALGYALEEAVGTDYLTTFVPEGDRKMLAAAFEQFAGSKAVFAENRVITKDGRELLVEWQGTPIFKGGKLDYFFGVGIDVTEQRQHQRELKKNYQALMDLSGKLEESERKYRRIVENAPVGIFQGKLDGPFTLVNNTLARQFECKTKGEFLTRYNETSKRWADLEEDRKFQNLLLKEKRVEGFEFQSRLRDGTEKWFSLNAYLDEPALKVDGFALDVTERKRAEYLLAEEKRVLEWIAQRKPLPEVLNEICRFIEELSSGAMSSILLLDAEGTRLWPIAAPKLPEDWCRAITPLAIGPAVGCCGTAAWGKEQVVASDIATDPRWADYPDYRALALKCGLRACWSTPILSAEGQSLGTFAMYYQKPRSPLPRDVDLIKQVTHLASLAIDHDRAADALRRSESRHRTLFESVQDSIFLCKDGRFVDCNPITLRMFGCRREEIIGQTPVRFSPTLQPDGRESAQKAQEKISAACAGVPQFFEWRHCQLDGSEFDAEVSLNRIEAAERPTWVAVVRDITARKQAEEALRRAHDELEQRVRERTAELVSANERLEELDRLKSQFLATMSHELRTPLNSIIGFTGILRQGFAGPVNDEQKKQLGLVFGSAKHLLSLINDLLDLSRIEAGKVEVGDEPFNFVDVIDDVVQNLAPIAAHKSLHLATDLPGPLIEMTGDCKRCYQILLNLANNAVKFTDQGEVKIIARTEGNNLRVCIADTGIGIKPEQMGRLFEAFRQLDGSAKRIYEGTGLGLHLCRKLLTLMGGQIGVESEFGKGSRFTFTLPRRLGSRPESQ